jgi:hypothetical protein
MKVSFISWWAVLCVLITPLAWPQSSTIANQPNEEGLVPIHVEGLDHVLARPGANLSDYDKVMLDPVEVSFSKSWKPDPAGGPITPGERQAIRDGMSRIVREELQKELAKSGRYSLTDRTDADVLRVHAEIRDLYINAPDLPRAGPTRTYALSVGEMRLVAELRDAPTGALIARIIDFKKDPDAPWLHFTTRVDNVAAARRAAADWARILRRQLDNAHAVKE